MPDAAPSLGPRLALMQPYFFPYLGYFQLIHAVDHWIAFDTPQYSKHGFTNRNRILHPTEGWQWMTVPLRRAPLRTAIRDVRVRDPKAACARILGQLDHHRRRAPGFANVRDLVRQTFAPDEDRLARINVRALELCCERLELPFSHSVLSEMEIELPEVSEPGHWPREIATAVGATCYINAPGGKLLFDSRDYARRGIQLRFLEPELPPYPQDGRCFIPGLSILDVLLWSSPGDVRAMLGAYRLAELPVA